MKSLPIRRAKFYCLLVLLAFCGCRQQEVWHVTVKSKMNDVTFTLSDSLKQAHQVRFCNDTGLASGMSVDMKVTFNDFDGCYDVDAVTPQ